MTDHRPLEERLRGEHRREVSAKLRVARSERPDGSASSEEREEHVERLCGVIRRGLHDSKTDDRWPLVAEGEDGTLGHSWATGEHATVTLQPRAWESLCYTFDCEDDELDMEPDRVWQSASGKLLLQRRATQDRSDYAWVAAELLRLRQFTARDAYLDTGIAGKGDYVGMLHQGAYHALFMRLHKQRFQPGAKPRHRVGGKLTVAEVIVQLGLEAGYAPSRVAATLNAWLTRRRAFVASEWLRSPHTAEAAIACVDRPWQWSPRRLHLDPERSGALLRFGGPLLAHHRGRGGAAALFQWIHAQLSGEPAPRYRDPLLGQRVTLGDLALGRAIRSAGHEAQAWQVAQVSTDGVVLSLRAPGAALTTSELEAVQRGAHDARVSVELEPIGGAERRVVALEALLDEAWIYCEASGGAEPQR